MHPNVYTCYGTLKCTCPSLLIPGVVGLWANSRLQNQQDQNMESRIVSTPRITLTGKTGTKRSTANLTEVFKEDLSSESVATQRDNVQRSKSTACEPSGRLPRGVAQGGKGEVGGREITKEVADGKVLVGEREVTVSEGKVTEEEISEVPEDNVSGGALTGILTGVVGGVAAGGAVGVAVLALGLSAGVGGAVGAAVGGAALAEIIQRHLCLYSKKTNGVAESREKENTDVVTKKNL
ncbi:uncharacterized protein LOC105007497 [Esox lucius]|uniref:uncharacterized protein LOC105007497 n=1 Tax=Esox lucius TaxID=8010 RepID=UPI0005771C3C|nr:uncharacterized protein LOC105007497 [Esox lucius]